jgi:uncharacterized protein
MKNDQQTLIEPTLFAQLSKSISGELDFSFFHRLSDLTKFNGKNVDYLLSFLYDDENRCCIEGKARVVIQLKCNRCLNFFPWDIETAFKLYPVESNNVNKLPKQFDAVIMEEGLISLIDVIEDELILSLPAVAKHADGDQNCRSLSGRLVQEIEVKEQRENPFAVLKSLYKTNDTQ